MNCPECEATILNESKQTDIYISHADKLVTAYGKEIYNDSIHSLTVNELIESHRHLRAWNIKYTTDTKRICQDIENKAYDDAYKDAILHDWVSKERLAGMTIRELFEIING